MQGTLFNPPPSEMRGPGRHEKMVRAALKAAEEKDMLTATDGAAVSLLIANSWALDQAEIDAQPFAIAQLTSPFVELMEKVGLIVVNEGSVDDKLEAALANLQSLD